MATIKANCVKFISQFRIHAKVDGKNVVVKLPVNVAPPEPGKDFDIAGRDWIDNGADPIAELNGKETAVAEASSKKTE